MSKSMISLAVAATFMAATAFSTAPQAAAKNDGFTCSGPAFALTLAADNSVGKSMDKAPVWIEEAVIPKAYIGIDILPTEHAFTIHGETSNPVVKKTKAADITVLAFNLDGPAGVAKLSVSKSAAVGAGYLLGDVTMIGGAGSSEHQGGLGILKIASLSADALKPPAARLPT